MFKKGECPVHFVERRGAVPDQLCEGEIACIPSFEICAIPPSGIEIFPFVAEAICREEDANLRSLNERAKGGGIIFFRQDVKVLPCINTKARDRREFFIHENIATAQMEWEGCRPTEILPRLRSTVLPSSLPPEQAMVAWTRKSDTFDALKRHGYRFIEPC